MTESRQVLDAVQHGYLRLVDLPPILAVTKQRVSQIVAEREDLPERAKVIGRHRLWRRKDVARSRDTKPRVWAPVE